MYFATSGVIHVDDDDDDDDDDSIAMIASHSRN